MNVRTLSAVRTRRYTAALRFAKGFAQTRFVIVSERYRPAMLTAVRSIRCKHQVATLATL